MAIPPDAVLDETILTVDVPEHVTPSVAVLTEDVPPTVTPPDATSLCTKFVAVNANGANNR